MPTLCKLLITFTIIVFLNSFNFAQSLSELEKVKEIKLLEYSRDNVRRILAEYKLQNDNKEADLDIFITDKAEIKVYFSDGECDENYEVWHISNNWDVTEGKVTQIEVIPKDNFKVTDIGINLARFKKENFHTDDSSAKIYHRKDLGIVIISDNEKIIAVRFEPPRKSYLKSCDKVLVRRLLATPSYFDPQIKERNRFVCGLPNSIPNVENLILSFDEITSYCSESENKSCSDNVKVIAIFAYAKDLDHDTLIYKYDISGGRILPSDNKPIDRSEKVLWDLSDVKPGIYTITAAVDDGCGFCGKTMTKTVTVKECLDCKKP